MTGCKKGFIFMSRTLSYYFYEYAFNLPVGVSQPSIIIKVFPLREERPYCFSSVSVPYLQGVIRSSLNLQKGTALVGN